MAHVLVIDDDPIFSETLAGQLGHFGHQCDTAGRLRQGVAMVDRAAYDLVFLDVSLPDGSGLDLIEKIKQAKSAPEIVIITGQGDPEGADLAIKSGAWDYLEKPASLKTLELLANRALEYRSNKQRLEQQRALIRDEIIGNSPKLMACLEAVAQAASTNSSVLITGETGTGKELFAKAIHKNSRRAGHQFIVVDCTSIPETLAESLLFGHLKGSFTGAHADKLGLFMQADGGSLFLDEIGDLSLSVQKSLLRVLQERKFRPIGSKQEKTSDFRLIAATNRNLEEMVKAGAFRKDLFYRLRAIGIHLSPLRERVEDVELLLDHYIPKVSKEHGLRRKKASPEVLDTLLRYNWPGNVRELVNTVHTACANSGSDSTLFVHHLPVDIRAFRAKLNLAQRKVPAPEASDLPAHIQPAQESIGPDSTGRFPTFKQARRRVVDTLETSYLQALLEHTGKDIPRACKTSGLSRARLYELLKKHGVGITPRA